MSRVQLALNVSDLDAAIAFYGRLFATEPAKVRPGYANFAIVDPPLKLVLIAGNGAPGSLNHLGVEVETPAEVAAAQRRLSDDGLPVDTEDEVACCYAVQDKVWVDGPDAEPWEIYTVLARCRDGAGQPGLRRRPRVRVALLLRRWIENSRVAPVRRQSAPRSSRRSSSAPGSPRNGCRPTMSGCSCSRTPSRRAPG